MKKLLHIYRQFKKFYAKYEEINGCLYYKLEENRRVRISL